MKTAVLLGMGGLGCPAALALAEQARDLRLLLVDPDRIDRSNLSRQILFRERDVGRLKVEAARERLRELVPGLGAIEASPLRFTAQTAPSLLEEADVVLDGTDDFATRFLANDAACAAGVPLVHGAVLGWSGQLLTVLPQGPCLRCLFEGPPPPGSLPTCAEAGVASPLCGVIGAWMATAALEVLDGRARGGVLRRFDGRSGRERPLELKRDLACAACGRGAS